MAFSFGSIRTMSVSEKLWRVYWPLLIVAAALPPSARPRCIRWRGGRSSLGPSDMPYGSSLLHLWLC